MRSMLKYFAGERSQSRPPLFVSFIWLVYLSFPLHAVFQRPVEERAIGLVIVFLFAAMYVYSTLRERGRFVFFYMQMAIIALFTLKFDLGFMFMGFYLTTLISMMPTTRKFIISWLSLFIFLAAFLVFYRFELSSDNLISFIPAILIMLFLPIAIRVGRRSRELREKLNLANEQIAILSANEERARISRDLHDTLGHSLSLITLKSELAEKLIHKNAERAIQEVRDIQATSRAALKQVRELVSGLNTATVDEEIKHAKQLLATANIELRLEGQFRDGTVTPLIDNILGMCMREAVTNVVRHSGAARCTIERTSSNDCLTLVVADNGLGCCEEDLAGNQREGNGLKGMRERLKLIEGAVRIESGEAKGVQGTRAVITVPLVNRSPSTKGETG